MLDGTSILVADDEEIMREILYSLLAREGCHVRMANDGETVVRVARDESFDAVPVSYTHLTLPTICSV